MSGLNDNLTRLSDARDDIAEAIVNKGGTVGRLDGFEDFSTDIASITNQYTVADEGKVVSNGSLVAQTAYPTTITENGTYNTTENNSVTVNVSASGNIAYKLSGTNAYDIYIIDCGDYIYIFGSSRYSSGSSISRFVYTIPAEFDTTKIGSLSGGALHGGNYGDRLIPGFNSSITLSGNTLTLTFSSTPYSKDTDIWTVVKITKAVNQ